MDDGPPGWLIYCWQISQAGLPLRRRKERTTFGSYDHRVYDLAVIREQEIASKAETARLLRDGREGRAAGVLRQVARAAKDALAPRNVRMPWMRAADGDVLA